VRGRILANYLSGNLQRRTMLFILAPLIFVFYFGTLALAAFVFPESYDWLGWAADLDVLASQCDFRLRRKQHQILIH
jgi:hypothetical protein